MVLYRVKDFEDDEVGSFPDGWTNIEQSGSIPSEVVDTSPIEGEKSFRIGDDARGDTRVKTDIGTPDSVAFSWKYHADEALKGTNRAPRIGLYNGDTWEVGLALSNGGNTADDEIKVTYHTSFPEQADIDAASAITFLNRFEGYDMEFRDFTSDFKLIIDGIEEFNSGDAFPGDNLRFIADDCQIYIDGFALQGGKVLLLGGGLALSESTPSTGDQVVLYSQNLARGMSTVKSGQDVILSDQSGGQGRGS